jgi:hypothetical protein
MKHTLLKGRKRNFLKRAAQVDLEGDFVELGTWRGGSARIVMDSVLSADRKNIPHCWMFDTFTGMPEPTEVDRAGSGRKHASDMKHLGMPDDDSRTYGICCDFLHASDYPKAKIHIIQGLFEDTFPVYSKQIEKVSILHVDCDFYESVKISLETFYDKVVSGGYIILDDYGFWEGAKKAVDEFMEEREIDKKLLKKVDRIGRWFPKP